MFLYINTNIGHHLTMFQTHSLSTLLGFNCCFRKRGAIHLRCDGGLTEYGFQCIIKNGKIETEEDYLDKAKEPKKITRTRLKTENRNKKPKVQAVDTIGIVVVNSSDVDSR
ncbi:hypothetical protein C5167_034703 [Papaver somniferum]|uniref:Peptidase C1A papain C-terminal domain-containing protein n=1 Tax=Papaver somniferum TaxID=3469 RepID=A0A4Y7KGH3_PAPSO|nr:hypothetical protein C5167_034703 [Papaver somniferum]